MKIIWTGSNCPSEQLKNFRLKKENFIWMPSIKRKPEPWNPFISAKIHSASAVYLSSLFSLQCLIENQKVPISNLDGINFVTVGAKLAQEVKQLGLNVEASFEYANQIPQWCQEKQLESLLSLGAKERAFDLPKALEQAATKIEELSLYQTTPCIQNSKLEAIHPKEAEALILHADTKAICFFSPSGVKAWASCNEALKNPPQIKIFSLGQTTSDALAANSLQALKPEKAATNSLLNLLETDLL